MEKPRGNLEKVRPRENLKLRDVPKANFFPDFPLAFPQSVKLWFPRRPLVEVQGHSPQGTVRDRYWKSRRGYLEKVPPRKNLKLRDVLKAKPEDAARGFARTFALGSCLEKVWKTRSDICTL